MCHSRGLEFQRLGSWDVSLRKQSLLQPGEDATQPRTEVCTVEPLCSHSCDFATDFVFPCGQIKAMKTLWCALLDVSIALGRWEQGEGPCLA